MTTNLLQNQRMEGGRPRPPHEHANFSTVACGARGRAPSMRGVGRLLCIAAILGASLCHAQTNIVYYGANTNALNVVFEDTALSASNQTLIVADLNVCLQSGWGRQAELYLRDKEDTIGYLYTEESPYYRGFPRDIVATPGGPALHIPQWLSNAYTNSFAFTAAHSNIVAAAYAFVAFAVSPDFANLPGSEVLNYYFAVPARDLSNGNDQKAIADLASYDYEPPSIRSFGYMKSKTDPGSEWFIMTIPVSYSPYGGIMMTRSTPAIWHDERWKFLDFRWFMD